MYTSMQSILSCPLEREERLNVCNDGEALIRMPLIDSVNGEECLNRFLKNI